MAVAQLFSFDAFLKLVASFDFPGGVSFVNFLAAFLVSTEVFALPFLLRMTLSPAFRWFSMVLGWLVALTGSLVVNVGFLGTVVNLMPGWWAVFIGIALGILAAWAAWDMWPQRKKLLEQA